MKDLSLGVIVSHLVLLVLFSTASLSAVGSDVSESPFSVKEYYARDRELCDEFIGNFKTVALENYSSLTSYAKANFDLNYITTMGRESNLLGFGEGEDLPWLEGKLKYESSPNYIANDISYMYEDINNDSIKELVVKMLDLNNVSDGYAWVVYKSFDLSHDDYVLIGSRSESVYFSYRSNNIDESSVDLGEGYHYHGYRDDRAQGTSRNFHFKFSKKDGKVYVLLMLHYGYDYVFQENLILADLDDNFRIDNQFCHYEIVQNFDIHPLRYND